MPYVVTSETSISSGAVSSFSTPIPSGHAANDVLLAVVTQDGGGTTIAASGWTQIGSQASSQSHRTTTFWKLASSSAESDFSATGATEEWAVCIVVIRNANTSTPIHKNNQTDSANSSSAYLDSGQVTTTENNCIIIHIWGFDNTGRLIPEDPSSLVFLGKEVNQACQIVGYYNLLTAGTTAVKRAINEVATEGGSAIVLAISDANPSSAKMGPDCNEGYTIIRRYGGHDSGGSSGWMKAYENITWLVASELTPTSISSVPLRDNTVSIREEAIGGIDWGWMTTFRTSDTGVDATGVWAGMCHAISSTDMSGKIFTLEFASYAGLYIGSLGYCVVFEDSSNNWVAFQISPKAGLSATNYIPYCAFIELETATPLDHNGTIDWSDITKIGYLQHRTTTSTTEYRTTFRNAFLFSRTTFVDGCAESPVTPAFVDSVLVGWGCYGLAALQSKGQALLKCAIRYGDGTRKTYVDTTATSLELPLAYSTSIKKRWWRVGTDSANAQFILKTSANDIIKMTSCVMATDTQQEFIIDAACSSSATYDFNGLSLVGWKVTHSTAGITMNGVVFKACRGITLNGGSINGCTIESSATSPAITTDDPGNISGCTFISSGSGHAITITAPGIYTFAGNSFTGYGADGSTDAAIYNNSGGAVTLNLSAGDSTPTVKNGAGATTTFANPPFDVTLQNVADTSRWWLYNQTTSTLVATGVQSGTGNIVISDVAYNGSANTLRLHVGKSTSAPFYRRFTTYIITDGTDKTVWVSQERE